MRPFARMGLAAMVAASMMSSGMEVPAIMPRPQEAPKPTIPRDERKKRLRRFGSLPKRIIRSLNRDYVAHDRDESGAARCGRRDVHEGWERRNGILLYGTHRFAQPGEPVMCNDCQRAITPSPCQERNCGMSAKFMLAAGFWIGAGYDVAAGAAIWFGKPWWVIFGLLVLGALCHPGAQPTLREMAKAEETV